ncbi:MAG: nucleotidyl transferase AbiEii/AbiGii toxin family protein [Actinobacteria bacterium]|nr:nucleotidyl transferase AbiEii/AbiGii toxin family protein [Actinomycetota bacterium]MBU1943855.1 nucleotidyl transferase AbiEii/AbiGii toxin family protein [Actinomycetota bacterium]MBU2687676.1 nucleotidyl transferase AbiEii/AbiGii toxin family protein [Actinomycetota bacterium]
MVTKSDYPADSVAACNQVLVELMTILGEYREHAVLVGGWVPSLYPVLNDGDYTGTTDIDLALNHSAIPEDAYSRIIDILDDAGYVADERNPAEFKRSVTLPSGREAQVLVHFMSGEYGGTTRGHRHQRVQDLFARKARGCDLVFLDNVLVRIEGVMPDGARNSMQIRLAGIVSFLAMKGMALFTRSKAKDAYDITYVLRNYPGGPSSIADEARRMIEHPLVREGFEKIRAKFQDVDGIGPVWCVAFEEITDEEAVAFGRRDSYQRATRLLDLLGIEPYDMTD